jgi:hypothetical protein
MNVKELIELLSQQDPGLNVYVRGYEDGVDDVGAVEPIRVVRDKWPDTWYYGDHDVLYSDDQPTEGAAQDGLQLVPGDGK